MLEERRIIRWGVKISFSEELLNPPFRQSQLEWLEKEAAGFGERVDIGTIAFGCALGYMDFRFPDVDWRAQAPRSAEWFEAFNRRASMQATLPTA